MDLQKPKPLRLYQVWRGSNRFLFGGRMIFGPDVSSLYLSTSLIVGPAVAFCIRISLIIRDNIRENKSCFLWDLVLVVAIMLTMLDMVFLFLTSSRDPGIVPRNKQPPECDEMVEVTTPSMEWVNGRTPHLKLARTKDVVVNGHTVKVKFCDTCLLYRAPRVSHCSICNNCVERFDHHCPWVGQCIGIRNYRFFYMFVATSTILCVYVFAVSLINILQSKDGPVRALSTDYVSDFLLIYCFIAVWFVGGLTIFHFYLISTNQTTYENFRYRYNKKENPYNKGIIKNFQEIFCSKIPPSLHDLREFVNEDDEMMAVGCTDTDSSKEKPEIESRSKVNEHNAEEKPDAVKSELSSSAVQA